MSKSLKKVLVISASLFMMTSIGAGANNVQAKHHHHIRIHRAYRRHVVPSRYRHTYYGGRRDNRMEYRIGKYYGYFTDNVRRHHHKHWIRYRLIRSHGNWFRAINNNYMSTPFKMKGNHIMIRYDVSFINMYR